MDQDGSTVDTSSVGFHLVKDCERSPTICVDIKLNIFIYLFFLSANLSRDLR